jgi:lipoic acid synthetase
LCPNRPECYAAGHLTVLILGDACTRACAFCAVKHGPPAPLDPGEPSRVAKVASSLGMRHVVVTSATRDDLSDGGASQYVAVAEALAALPRPPTREALIPDLRGDRAAVAAVAAAPFHVLAHNVETVPRLYSSVRPQADYRRSLGVLRALKRIAPAKVVKSGFMLGLGESADEVRDLLRDLRACGVDALAVGQYLRPTARELPVMRYASEEEFAALAREARALGFLHVASGALVRSSYRAGEAADLFDRAPAG